MDSFFRILAMLVVFFVVIYLQYNRPNQNSGQRCRACSFLVEEPMVTEVSEPVESLSQELESQED